MRHREIIDEINRENSRRHNRELLTALTTLPVICVLLLLMYLFYPILGTWLDGNEEVIAWLCVIAPLSILVWREVRR